MKLLAILAGTAVLATAGYVRFAADPPGLDRARLHHWQHADGMTALAKRMLELPDVSWIAIDDGVAIAAFGTGKVVATPEPLPDDLQQEFLALFDRAQLGMLFVGATNGSAFAELGWLWLYRDREYSSAFVYRGRDHEPCDSRAFSKPEGACEYRLDENWTLDYLWYPKIKPGVTGRGDS